MSRLRLNAFLLVNRVELWAVRRPRTRPFGRWLATRRLNRVVDGLLTSIWWQVQTGLYRVVLARREGESDEMHALREAAADGEHARGALTVIGLFVRNELRQRGLLHRVDEGRLDWNELEREASP